MKAIVALAVALAFIMPGAATSSDEKLETDTCPDPMLPHPILDPGDILFNYNVSGPSGDDRCIGVEFDGTYFYITGGGEFCGGNKIHFFQADGTYIASVDQNTTSCWGWHDIGYDGNHMYSGDEDGLVEWYVTGLPNNPVLNKVGNVPVPLNICCAMAYDPDTDHFWTADWDSHIYEFERNGNIVSYYPNSYYVCGMAWDNVSPDGPWLWVFSQDGTDLLQISQFDPIDGVYTGIIYNGSGDGWAGGACFIENWEEKGVFVGLTQDEGQPDSIFGMEIFANPPILEIGNITGGLFKINAVIKNIGSVDATDVDWSIILDGGFILLGGQTTDRIDCLPAQSEISVSSDLIIGFGKTVVTVCAEIPESSAAKEQDAFVLLFFIFII